ncbi:MAG: hypothetical protein DFNUSKGM_002542, partial [Candidatus Fervidibacter sacchari]
MVRAIMMGAGVLFVAILLVLGKEVRGMSEWVVTVKTEQPLRLAFLQFDAPIPSDAKSAQVVADDGQMRPAQIVKGEGGKTSVVWLEANLPANTQRTYRIQVSPDPAQPKVVLKQEEKWVTVSVNGQLFTRYYFTTEFAKPFCFPLVGPNGKVLTRGFPVEP